jgi:D-beta-D-heptose 7-phosphate kinase/D-beta-D-heptose 1-phosphate adenosyltransferase
MVSLKNKSPRLLVIGDLMVDQYLWGTCGRISPEAPVQIINIDRESELLGGAGNVVNNLKKLGAYVDVISVIGNCSTSEQLTKLFSEIEVSTKFLIIENSRNSTKKTRIIASQQQVIRYDQETSDDITKESRVRIIELLDEIILNYDVILLSDYGKGVLTTELTRSIIKTANKYNKKVLIDPKGSDYSKYKGAFLLTPNKKEASEATKIEITDDKSLVKAIKKLKSICNLNKSLITLSENGVAIFDESFRIHPTIAKEVFDVTGAGDTVLASIGFALASGLKIDDSIEFANLAAGIVVGKIGSATTSVDEIIQFKDSMNQSSLQKHIKSISEIIPLVNELKKQNKRIVFTNGCYDLIHPGHIKYLIDAKKLGDILVVGLNSDKSVTSLKGDTRPINNQDDRACILAAIEAVDYIVIFNEDTPYKLIKLIKPHILVKGGDYEGKDVVGQDIVEEVKLVKFVNGYSTSKSIEKIKNI